VIHTDFEKGFIRAEVMLMKISFITVPEAKCKEAEKFQSRRKEYIVTWE
jgi:ribosome-binding ATPase YchF (GTP1/OBG family)